MSRRETLLVLAIAAALLAGSAWAYQFMSSRRRLAKEAREGLEQCRTYARQIEDCWRRPARAAEREIEVRATTAMIEEAARGAGVAPSSLTRTAPEPPQGVEGSSSYKEKPTRVFLDGVNAKQIVGMLHRLAVAGQPLHAKSLRLVAPDAADTGDLWRAEMVLTYLIYAPAEGGK